jgi:RNA polymerase sigma-70 factor (ECF subfamily)
MARPLRKSRKIGARKANIPMNDDDSTLHTRPSLLVRIRDAQDGVSWQTFVDTYAPVVYRYCRLRSLQDADAADVTQDVLTEVARCIRTFVYQPERGRFRDWLGTLTRRRLARHLDKQNRGVVETVGDEGLDEVGATQADAEWTDEFNAQVLQVALERVRPHFEPATWQAFEAVWLHNRSAAQAAEELQLPIEAVYVAKSRVLKRLEEEVRTLAEDVPQLMRPG